MWAPVVAGLAERHRVIIPDLPGLGASPPADVLGAAAFARWLAELLRLTCDEAPVLVAHSLSGSLAARFAAGHGALLRRLVVYAAPGHRPVPHARRPQDHRGALRAPADRAQHRAVRAPRAARPGRRARPRPRLVRRPRGRAPVAGERARREAHDAAADRGRHGARARRRAPCASPCPSSSCGAATTASCRSGWRRTRARGSGLALRVVDAAGHAAHLDRPGRRRSTRSVGRA